MRRFVLTANAVAATTKKLEKVRLVGDFLRSLTLEDATCAAIFFAGRAFPRRDERVLGIGGSSLYRLVLELSGKSADELAAIYRQHGDLGAVAEQVLAEAPGPTEGQVSLVYVAQSFAQLAAARGQAQKYGLLKSLLEKCSPGEVKYVVKIITGDLRIGFEESLVEEAIAKAFERSADAVRRANMLTGDVGETLRLAAAGKLAEASITLFHPIGFMLATAVNTAAELFAGKRSPFLVEEKYDGIRAQIHKRGDRVKVFSRTLDEVREFPELTAPALAVPGEFILDGEILAWQEGHPLPFTELQKRLGRKSTQTTLWAEHDVPVCFMAFDLLYGDGALYLDTPLALRRARLAELLSAARASPGIELAARELCDSEESVQAAFRRALAAGHEGIVAKDP